MKTKELTSTHCFFCDEEDVPGTAMTDTAGPHRDETYTYCQICWESGLATIHRYPGAADRYIGMALAWFFRQVLSRLDHIQRKVG